MKAVIVLEIKQVIKTLLVRQVGQDYSRFIFTNYYKFSSYIDSNKINNITISYYNNLLCNNNIIENTNLDLGYLGNYSYI